jgi:hypothetical protein
MLLKVEKTMSGQKVCKGEKDEKSERKLFSELWCTKHIFRTFEGRFYAPTNNEKMWKEYARVRKPTRSKARERKNFQDFLYR